MIRTVILAALAATASAPAFAAERNFSVTTFDRVRVEGPFAVRLETGRAPSARASGSQQALEGVSVTVQGRTLIVRPNRSSWRGYPGQAAGPVSIALSTHELGKAALNGSGSLAIDRVKGLTFEATVHGSGGMSIEDVAVDRLSAGIVGAGTMELSGKTLKASLLASGPSSLDAAGLEAKDATIAADGPATVSLSVGNTAQVGGSGTGVVTLDGRPACSLRVTGSLSVSGCR